MYSVTFHHCWGKMCHICTSKTYATAMVNNKVTLKQLDFQQDLKR